MNKEQLIHIGCEIEKVSEPAELCEKYENWKTDVLRYASGNAFMEGQCRIMLHAVDVPYESREDKLIKYRNCIKKTIGFLRAETESKGQNQDALETIVKNFGLYLHSMFSTAPENRATLDKNVLSQITINNEYDLQHMMYAVIKALYPSARREVSQDIGYGTDRYDIILAQIDTVIEMKCTRKGHTEKKLFRELGEDAFFYKCSRLIIYVYDRQNVIHDMDNFARALQRNKETAGKEVRVFVEQKKDLI